MTIRNVKWDSAVATDKGHVRQINEDACLDGLGEGYWVVADGMGGHSAGDFASALVCDSLKQVSWRNSLSQMLTDFEDHLLVANQKMLDKPESPEDIVGTTVVALLFGRKQYLYLWVGDSRLYRLRDGQLSQLTQDHTEVEELVMRGQLKAEEAESHPDSNVITRALGVDKQLALDMDCDELREGDVFLLCSDGLNKDVPNDHIKRILMRAQDASEAADTLVQAVLAGSASDNVTVCVVRVLGL